MQFKQLTQFKHQKMLKTNARAELLTERQNKITEILNNNETTSYEEKGNDIEP